MPKGATQLKANRTAGSRVLEPKHTMKPINDSSKVQEELRLIHDAIKWLAVEKPALLRSFLDAFTQRSQFAELPESRGEVGLIEVFAELLWKYVPDPYFDEALSELSHTNTTPEELKKLLRALEGVLAKHSFVMQGFRRVRENRQVSTRSAIEACLRFYVGNKQVFPG